MLKKNSDLIIDPKKPFDSDALERKPSIELLTKLVQSTKQPFVLSVEAPFGFGKTTFLNLWKAYLESEGHLCLHFNAWENDFVEDPLVAFLGEMDRALAEAVKDKDGFPIAEAWKEVKGFAGKIVRKGLPFGVQIATLNVLKAKDVKEIASVFSDHSDELAKNAGEFTQKKLVEYESSRRTIKGFRESLSEFAKRLAKEKTKGIPIVFFIDELDRCRPDFAVVLLERIKHLFQVEGFFFVLGMDREQLAHSVSTLYGQNMDADGYLRRFMDLRYRLPEPAPDRFARLLYGRFKMEELFQFAYGREQGAQWMLDFFPKFAKQFKLSLRVQEQCFTEINLALRTQLHGSSSDIVSIAFLVCLRAYDRQKYDLVIAGKIDPRVIGKLITDPELQETGIAEAVAMSACPNPGRQRRIYEETVARCNAADSDEEKNAARRAVKTYDQLHHSLPPGQHSIIEHLEMLTRFRGF